MQSGNITLGTPTMDAPAPRQIPYRDIPDALSGMVPFRGSSMQGVVQDDAYVVYSYATPIAIVRDGICAILPRNRWGATTGRHLNLCRAHLPGKRAPAVRS